MFLIKSRKLSKYDVNQEKVDNFIIIDCFILILKNEVMDWIKIEVVIGTYSPFRMVIPNPYFMQTWTVH